MTEYPAAGHRAARRREGDGVELVHEKIRRLILSGELLGSRVFSVVQLAAQEHRATFSAVAARDAEASARSLAMHLSRTACGVMDLIRPGDVPVVLDGILHDLVGAAAADLSPRRRLAADD